MPTPSLLAATVMVMLPLESVPDPRLVLPEVSVTVPVGVAPVPETATVTLRLWPVSTLLGDGVTFTVGVRVVLCVMVTVAVPVPEA